MAKLYKRRRKDGTFIWYVNYMSQGKFRMKSTGTADKKLALEIMRRLEDDLIRIKKGMAPLEEIVPILLSEFIEIYAEDRRKRGKAAETITTDRYSLDRLLKFTGDCSLTSITDAVALQYRDYKLERVKPATASIELRSLRAAFNWAIEKPGQKFLHRNPFAQKGIIPGVETKTIPMILSPEEKANFFAGVDDPGHERLFKFLLLTGCRRSEALNLTWVDIDLEQKQLTFRRTKTKKDRTIPINLELMQVILSLDHNAPKPFNWTPDWVSRLFKRYLKRAGITKDLHLHCLRHTAASDLVRRGVHLTKISKFLGHSSVRVTEIYTHVLPEDLREVAEAITCVG